MKKIQFASGGNNLEGWLNLDYQDGDITKPLKFEDNSVDFILIEHGLEHVTPQQGYTFLKEAHRILTPRGVIRVIVPDITKVWEGMTDSYMTLVKEGIKTWWPQIGRQPIPNPTKSDAIETLVFCHGHQALYTEKLLLTIMRSIGFEAYLESYSKSLYEELDGVDSHWKHMGFENCILESVVVEGIK